MNIEENIKPLKILMSKYKQIDEMNNFDHELALVIDYTELSAIETLLTAYEKEKEKNKEAEEKIKKYIDKIQKELDKYKIKNTNTYIQIEGNPEINGLLIQKATLEELIKGGIKQC